MQLKWAGGENDFLLHIKELRALQTATDCGPGLLFKRLGDGDWLVDDLLHVLRLGLIGGGMPEGEASKLIGDVVDNTPLLSLSTTAYLVLSNALVGEDHDQLGESSPTEEVASPSASTKSGDSPDFTKPAPSPDSAPEK